MSQTCLPPGCNSYLSGPLGQTFMSSIQLLFAAQCLIQPDWPQDASSNITDLIFDYIVVGAGSAGCVVAGRLSENANVRVLLVEAGGDPPLESVISSGLFVPQPEYDWRFETEPELHACGSTGGICILSAGKVLGGGSSINANHYVRGNRHDYDTIAAAGNEGWDYETALEYFKKSENMTSDVIKNNPDLAYYHNFSGPISVSVYKDLTKIDKIVINGYRESGQLFGPDYNGRNQLGVFRSEATIGEGRRQSTARAYIIPAGNRSNFVLFKHSLVTKILINDKVATGVEILLNNGSILKVTARKEVIVSAGVIKTPQLLMLSGIGPKEELDKFNIPVIADLSVGMNFVDHTAIVLPIQATAPIHFQLESEIPKDVAEFLMFGTGFYNREHSPISNLIAFIKTTTDWESRNLPNFRLTIRAAQNDPTPLSIIDGIEVYNVTLNIYMEHLDPISRGRVCLFSTDPTVAPKVIANYFGTERDVEMNLRAFKFIESLINSQSFKSINAEIPPIILDACESTILFSECYWRCIISQLGRSSLHYRGTAKMGPSSDPNAVVNNKLQIYGVKNLRVVDGSVIPGTIRGNTNAAIIMFAERASDLIMSGN